MKKLLFVFPIVALLAAGCNSFQQQVNQIPVQNPAPTQPGNSDTQNWKNYTDNTYGFSFQYPAGWTLVQDATTPVGAEYVVSKDDEYNVGLKFPSNFEIHPSADSSPNSNDAQVVIAEEQAYKEQDQFGTNYYFINRCGDSKNLTECFEISLRNAKSDDLQILEQILSTFKFTQPQTTNSDTQVYNGSGFTFQYPTDWAISLEGSPSKNPSVCGDAWGNATSCVSLDPSQLAKNVAGTVFVLVFKTNSSPLSWCQPLTDRFSNCQTTTINGYTAATASSPTGDLPVTHYKIVSSQGTLIAFQTHNPTYQSEFDTIAGSIKFLK